MKYTRLSKEQFESLNEKFAVFLAAQSIDKIQWDQIKSQNPSLTDQSLDKIIYLENRSDHHLFLFKCEDSRIDLILIKLKEDCPSLMQKDYKQWLVGHLSDPRVTIFESSRSFPEDFKDEKFKLMNKGATISEGETFEDLKSFLSK
jgi:hypothetical protein